MKKSLMFLVLLGVAGVAWYGFNRFGKTAGPDEELPEFRVKRGNLTINVLEGGNIQALEYLQVKSEVKSTNGVKILKVIEEGYQVTPEDVNKGKILVQLDASTLEDQIVDHDVEFQQTESLFADAKQDIEIAESSAMSKLKADRQALRFALMDFEKYVGKNASDEILVSLGLPHSNEGLNQYEEKATQAIASSFSTEKLKELVQNEVEDRPFEAKPEDSLAQGVDFESFLKEKKLSEGEAEQLIRKLTDDALVASSQLAVVKNSVDGARRLQGRAFITEQELRNEELNLQKAELSVKSKEIEKVLFVDYEFPKEAQKMLSRYEEALADLIRTKRAAMATISKAYARYRSSKRRYELELKKRADLEEQLKSCSIRAQKPGLVAYGGTDQNFYTTRYYESIAEGATLKYGQPIITIPDMSKLGVDVSIHESHIKKVALHQKVWITAESVPDRVLEGRVAKLAVLPDSNASRYNPSLKVYPATIEISGNNDFLKPGMSAKVEIVIDELKEVIYIPVQAVLTESDEHFVFLRKDSGFERHCVKIGQHNADFIEIKEGLDENDVVALAVPGSYKKKNDAAGPKERLPKAKKDSPNVG